jgi:RES domain-containing protein
MVAATGQRVKIWRLCKKDFAATAFSGIGARDYPGRWNEKGWPVVYTAGSLALAALEYFVHIDADLLPENLVAIEASIPPSVRIKQLKIDDLPKNWRDIPAPNILSRIGTDWLRSHESTVLAVPSVVIPVEMNYLINPDHQDFKKIKIGRPQAFAFDSRMHKSD